MSPVPCVSRRAFCAGSCLLAAGGMLGAEPAPPEDAPLKRTGETRGGLSPGMVKDYRKLGRFFLVVDARGIYALTAVCTHRGCTVNAAGTDGFDCPCHDSVYDLQGHVVQGPAQQPLRHLLVREPSPGAPLEVDVSVTVDPDTRL